MNPARILLVEDEFIVALGLKTALEGMGYVVCGMVASGEEAIDFAERERPDCVLMDVSLKGEMDGIETARHIRTRFGIRTAFLSGYPAEDIVKRAADVGPIGLFVKPLEYSQLEHALGTFFLARAEGCN